MNTISFIKKYVVARIFILLLLMQIMRVIFFIVNSHVFLNDTFKLVQTFFYSIGFDLASILLYLLPYCLLVILFLCFKKINRWQSLLLTIYFSVVFWVVALLSFIDVYYYKFNLRRVNLEAVSLASDSKSTIVHFATQHASSIVLLLLLVALFVYSLRKTTFHSFPYDIAANRKKGLMLLSGSTFIIMALFFRFAKYLSPLSASLLVEPGYTGLYTNSPQVFIYSYTSNWTYVEPVNFIAENEIDNIYPVFYANADSVKPTHKNVMLFILESFSYAYLDSKNPTKPYTPFFDSLIQHSTFYDKAYANNITSANGLSSMISGLPSLTNQAFFASPYSINPIDAVGTALVKNGYETHFAMGANDDHFGFKKGTRLLGINHYINGESLPKEQYDGTWGIFDEPFLQFYANKVVNFKQPFFSTLFTISSHEPFKVPDSLKNKFPKRNGMVNEQSISYVDYSFRHFFEKVKNEPWFQNTIFIFTGDHVSKENRQEKFNFNSFFHIPIFVYDPQQPIGVKSQQLIQHIDFPASIAKMTGIKDSVLSFGQPFNDTTRYRFTVNRHSENIVQMIDTSMLLQYDIINNKCLDVYHIYANDSIALETNKEKIEEAKTKKVALLKAFMQQYFNRLYNNQLSTYTSKHQ